MRQLAAGIAVVWIMMSGCHHEKFSDLEDEFVYTTLAFSPTAATSAGLHQFQGKNLDQLLDDMSLAAFDRQQRFYHSFQERLAKWKRESLSDEEQADYDIISDQIAASLLELEQIQSYVHNPTMYVELIGNALFNPYVLEYAPKESRIRDIMARMQQLPMFVDRAKVNLASSPRIWTQVAQEENEGNIGLIQKTIAAAVPESMRAEYDRTAQAAVKSLESLQDYLKNHLSARDDYDWRLGKDKYYAKFRSYLETDQDPSAVLAMAEEDLLTVRKRMYDLALPLYRKTHPSGDTDQDRVLTAVLDQIAQKHSTPETYMADAEHDLEEARAFVEAKKLLTLPTRGNLKVIETPEFMRGIYAVGGFNPAPALEPQLGAFYWITPIPKNWPAERVQSKLREYNFYNLKLLTIHEAMPGHYVQFEIADDMQPKSRRVLRALYGNNAYVEGWAQYATQMMLDNGYLNNSPELRLTLDKQELRVLANSILDVRLHTLNMSDQEALDLMQKQTFQEKEEATAKLQRAKLSSCQLPTYLVGWRGWNKVREEYRRAHPGSSLMEFNDRALKEGAVPLPVLGRLLGAGHGA